MVPHPGAGGSGVALADGGDDGVVLGEGVVAVPYRGATQAAADLAAGHVQVMFIAHSLALSFLDSGRVRLIAFAGPERSAAFPQVPTVAESGVENYDSSSWIALYAPRGTPEPIVARLREEGARALATPAVRERLTRAGLDPWAQPPAALERTQRADFARWQRVVRSASITAN